MLAALLRLFEVGLLPPPAPRGVLDDGEERERGDWEGERVANVAGGGRRMWSFHMPELSAENRILPLGCDTIEVISEECKAYSCGVMRSWEEGQGGGMG